jgi:glyoxylase-like metal-dependent hydrolase (beta-lactamase superfamily II)
MKVQELYDPATFTLTYVVFDEATRDAVVIDPVLDYDQASSTVRTHSVDRLVDFVRQHELRVHWVLETHAHADHLSASQVLKKRLEARIAIGARIVEVQQIFRDVFDLGKAFPTDGRQFDRLLRDREVLEAGALKISVLPTPGHTPACVSYLIGDAVFTGDALFMDDYGTGRTDFPGGSAAQLYRSVHDVLYALADETRVFVGHDYQPNGRDLRFETTIGRSKHANVQLRADTTEPTFVEFRKARDATLRAPQLLLPSVQVNIAAGALPARRENGRRYLALPISVPPELD